jgi:hypothetical protein
MLYVAIQVHAVQSNGGFLWYYVGSPNDVSPNDVSPKSQYLRFP